MPAGLPPEVVGLAEALLIGFLIGAQREATQGEGHPGVRDFVLIAVVGGIAGILQNPWLTVGALLSVTALLGVFYHHTGHRTGITTEMAALATYCLGYLAAVQGENRLRTLAVGTAVVVVIFLEAKRAIHRLVRETITEKEFDDTLRFLAVVFVIYPILPGGEYGPYGFLAPKKIWGLVMLVSAVSYCGYFLTKFLGARRGLRLMGVLGGLASSTAATLSFAAGSSEEPQNRGYYAQAAILANAIQFPRVLLILAVVNPVLAAASAFPLAAMTGAGLLAALLLGRAVGPAQPGVSLGLRNPFRLWPALQFGALFAAVLLVTRAAAQYGGSGLYWASGLAGSVDVDAVALSMADLVAAGSASPPFAAACLLLALGANAVVKSGIAGSAGQRDFALRLAGAFGIMYTAGGAVWWLSR
ncbi:MAG: MgtC/SapB family protein [Bryobacteraceae bacterium]